MKVFIGVLLTIYISSFQVAHANDSYAKRYADTALSYFLESPICNNLRNRMLQIVNSSLPENIKVLQIDKIIDSADRVGCLMM